MVVLNRCGSCGHPPMTDRTSSAAKLARSWPLSRAAPPLRSQNRSSTEARVDLPAPLAPTSATRRPGGRSRLTRSRAGGPSGRYRTVASSSWMPNGPGGSARGRPGARTGSGVSVTAAIRPAATRAWSSWTAAAGRAVTASNAASAVRVRTASGTRDSVPVPVAATPRSRTAHSVSPDTRLISPVPRPLAAAVRRASRVSSASAASARSSAASAAPKACRSAAPSSRSVTVAASRPRAGAPARAAMRATAAPASGTARPAASSPAASTAAAGVRMNRHTVTAPPPTRAAASTGVTPRMNRSWVASTSEISRASRSPEWNSASPAGASASSRRQIATRTWASTRKATSWEASRSR